jgi:mono/diheme cytochrome c family protein
MSNKRKIKTELKAALLWGLLFLPAGLLMAQDGAALFKTNCSACHNIGKGRLVGPDLKGVTNKRSEEWLGKFIKASQSFINSGDADAKAIFDEYKVVMPDFNLPDADISAIIAYVASQSPAEAEQATETEVVETATTEEAALPGSETASKDDILKGANLFSGRQSFENGGPSCLSCHNVSNELVPAGGLLAKDLTMVYSRLGGDAGLQGILKSFPFPAMAHSYKNKPLTDEEVRLVSAFLYDADKSNIYQVSNSGNGIFIYGGGIALVVILVLIGLLWYNRKKNNVKYDIYNRQIKSSN